MPETRTIPLSQGFVTVVDAEDYDRLSQWKWYATSNRDRTQYAVRWQRILPSVRKIVFMHRQILATPADMEGDHRNGDSLDNRRCNLRICTHQDNMHNARKCCRKTSSRYKGVYWKSKNNKWVAQIGLDGKRYHLGTFTIEEEAALSYNEAAIEQFGEFACLNVIEEYNGQHPGVSILSSRLGFRS